MGLMYILLGEPFDKSRQDVEYLMKFFNSSYQGSALMPQEIEIWYYEVSEFDEEENYNGWFFQDGVAWLFFEKDFIYWQFGEKTLGLFYNYENYYQTIMFGGSSITYATYIGEVYRFIDAAAKGYIYDKDLTFEEMFIEWVPIKKD